MSVRRFFPWVLAAALALTSCVARSPAVPAATQADADYLLHLGLMRGHLLVGHALLALGERAAAQSHAKHPSDELYAAVAEQFQPRGAVGFAAQLEAHANALAADDGAATRAAYAAVTAAIERAELSVAMSSRLAGRVIVLLLREAALEYDIGVVDGRVVNAHEYQDAYGFTQVALARARSQHAALPADDGDRAVFASMARRIEALNDLWPALMPPPDLSHSATRLYAAALAIEGDALKFKATGRFRQRLQGDKDR